MNTTLRISLVALLALIPILVVTGCGTPMAGVASPAGTTSSSTSTGAPTVPNSVPNSGPNSEPNSEATTEPPDGSSTTSPDSTASPQEPSSKEPEPSGPAVLPTDLGGEVYGFIRSVDVGRSQLTLDKIDWLSGAEAEGACAEDAVPQEAYLDGWCSIYYFRNVNPALRVVTVSPDAVITTLEGNIQVNGTLATLADEATSELGLYHPYRLVVADGAIVQLTEIYQP